MAPTKQSPFPPLLSKLDLYLDQRPLDFHSILTNLRRLAESLNAAILVLLHTRTCQARSSLASALSALCADHVLALDFFPTDRPRKATPFNKLVPRNQSGYLHLRTLTVANSLPPFEGGRAGVRGPISLHFRYPRHRPSLFPIPAQPTSRLSDTPTNRLSARTRTR